MSLLLFALSVIGLVAGSRRAPTENGILVRDRPANRIAHADLHPWGANFFLDLEVEAWNQEKTVREAAAAGIRWAKQMIPWYDVEPEPGEYRWDKYDRIVDLYRRHGIEVVARLDFPPAWVEPASWVPQGKAGPPDNLPPADFDAYAAYVARVVEHFKGRVGLYQIWNEPNLTFEWGYGRVDPAGYAQLLAKAAAAAREVDPDVVILSAPLAINLESVDLAGNMSDLSYMEALYRERSFRSSFDVLSVNAFGMAEAPDTEPRADRLNFRRMELARQVMVESDDACKPIWAAEFGWNAAPADLESIWGRVSPEAQAEHSLAAVDLAQERWPWAGVFNLWYFRHCCQSPESAVYHFQLLDPAFRPSRLYTAMRAAAARPPEAGRGYWSERSAPVTVIDMDHWRWRWDARPENRGCDGDPDDPSSAWDHRYLESSGPEARLRFRFEGGGAQVRVRYGPQAGTLAWNLAGRAPERRQTLAGEAAWRWVSLAEGLPAATHEVELGPGLPGGSIAIDGFRVLPAATDGAFDWRLLVVLLALVSGTLALVDGRYLAGRLPQ